GPGYLADASASLLLFMPISLATVTLTKVLTPYWSRLRQAGEHKLISQQGRNIKFLLMLLISFYIFILLEIKEPLLETVFGDNYATITNEMFILWGAIFFVQAIRSNYSIFLQVYLEFQKITQLNTVSAITVLLSSTILVQAYGVTGALMALLLGEVLLMFLLRGRLKNVRN
ncbi:MAG: hypothetical protein R3240_07020, partial [Gammaproteobacteria bacterium]|nr:hypothetical protein [Gammaproteobacteria bacterium]